MSICKPPFKYTYEIVVMIFLCFIAWTSHDCMKRPSNDITPAIVDLCVKTCKPSGVSYLTTSSCNCNYSR